jgi:hypothetical protein
VGGGLRPEPPHVNYVVLIPVPTLPAVHFRLLSPPGTEAALERASGFRGAGGMFGGVTGASVQPNVSYQRTPVCRIVVSRF